MIREDLSSEQMGAIWRAANLGRTLQEDCGDKLKASYIEGKLMKEIVDEFDIQSRYHITAHVAVRGVFYALAGFEKDDRHCGAYEGLIPDRAEREKIGKEHKAMVAKAKGIDIFKKRKGIHAQTLEQRKELGHKGGSIGGQKNYQNRVGIHAQSEEGRREAGYQATRAKGLVVWSDAEKTLLSELSRDPYFRRGSNANAIRIAQALNGTYHGGEEIRNRNAVVIALGNRRKSLGETTAPPVRWSDEERKKAYSLSESDKYKIISNDKKKINIKKIRDTLVELGYPSRTRGAVKIEIDRIKRSLEERAQTP
ncbi:MAG: hypothetical protein AABX53_01450 [Nanoarchaeota archaeon]